MDNPLLYTFHIKHAWGLEYPTVLFPDRVDAIAAAEKRWSVAVEKPGRLIWGVVDSDHTILVANPSKSHEVSVYPLRLAEGLLLSAGDARAVVAILDALSADGPFLGKAEAALIRDLTLRITPANEAIK